MADLNAFHWLLSGVSRRHLGFGNSYVWLGVGRSRVLLVLRVQIIVVAQQFNPFAVKHCHVFGSVNTILMSAILALFPCSLSGKVTVLFANRRRKLYATSTKQIESGLARCILQATTCMPRALVVNRSVVN